MIKVTYRLTAEDIVACQRIHRSRSLLRRIYWFAATVFFVLLAASGIALQFSAPWRPAGQFLILFAFIFFVLQPIQRWQWRRAIRKSPTFQADVQAEFSEERFLSTGPLQSGEIAWAGYIDAVEGSDHFVLYPAPNVMHCIPKRAFDSTQLSALRDLLRRKIPGFRSL